MIWDRGHNSPVTGRDASGIEPTVHGGMSADIQSDATVLTRVGHTVYRKIVAWEVWS